MPQMTLVRLKIFMVSPSATVNDFTSWLNQPSLTMSIPRVEDLSLTLFSQHSSAYRYFLVHANKYLKRIHIQDWLAHPSRPDIAMPPFDALQEVVYQTSGRDRDIGPPSLQLLDVLANAPNMKVLHLRGSLVSRLRSAYQACGRKIRKLILDQTGQRVFNTSEDVSDSLVGGKSLGTLEVEGPVSGKLIEVLPKHFPHLHTINMDMLTFTGISALATVLRTVEHLPQLRCVSIVRLQSSPSPDLEELYQELQDICGKRRVHLAVGRALATPRCAVWD